MFFRCCEGLANFQSRMLQKRCACRHLAFSIEHRASSIFWKRFAFLFCSAGKACRLASDTACQMLGACPSNGRDCDGSEMSRMRGGGSSRLLMMSLRDPTTKQAGHFSPTPRGDVLFGPPLRRGSSEYHPCQVRHRRRFLMVAKNRPGAPGSQPGDYSDRLLDAKCQIPGSRFRNSRFSIISIDQYIQ